MPKVSWVGLKVDEYRVERELGEGAFSRIYLASSPDQAQQMILKIAKTPDEVDSASETNTQAHVVWSGFVQQVKPDAHALIHAQAVMLKGCRDLQIVPVEQLPSEHSASCYVMPWIKGPTLRECLNSKKSIDLVWLRDLALALARLKKSNQLMHHGDLKPENLILSTDESGVSRLVLIDPGYFGKLDCAQGKNLSVKVTTPSYYPFLEPDDLLAFGIIAWELATKHHPLKLEESPTSPEVNEDVVALVERCEIAGQFFLSKMRNLRRPTAYHKALAASEAFLFRALRLDLNAKGLMMRSSGFTDFEECAASIEDLMRSGVTSW